MAYRSFRGGSGRLDTRLDTPPSINGHHPVSPAAPPCGGCSAQIVPAGMPADGHGRGPYTRRSRLDLIGRAPPFIFALPPPAAGGPAGWRPWQRTFHTAQPTRPYRPATAGHGRPRPLISAIPSRAGARPR